LRDGSILFVSGGGVKIRFSKVFFKKGGGRVKNEFLHRNINA